MKLLIDTHIFLWAITADSRMSAVSLRLFEDPEHELLLSAGGLWEMMVKNQLGKLPLPKPVSSYLRDQLKVNRIEVLSLSAEHVYRLEDLPALHRDPFDRILVAQAMAERIPVITQDAAVRQYGVKCLG